MKKIFIFLFAVLAMASTSSFISCGSDDDAKEHEGKTDALTVGKHRIDVDFEGETLGWDVIVSFVGSGYPNPAVASNLYEDGKLLQLTSGSVWMSEEFRSYSVSTDDNSQSLTAMVMLTKRGHATPRKVTVNLKGYVNGKMTKMKSFAADGSHPSKSITFSSEVDGADQEIDMDY